MMRIPEKIKIGTTRYRRLFTGLIIFFLIVPLWVPDTSLPFAYNAFARKGTNCSSCGKRLSNYLEYSNKRYCSKRCLSKAMPKCSQCNKTASFKREDGKYFCSQGCLSETWPQCSFCSQRSQSGVKRGNTKVFLCSKCAKKPRCFSCQMPANHSKFSDGRYNCKVCNKTAVLSIEKAKKLSNEVRKTMKDKLGIVTDHKIHYFVVGQNKLKDKVQHDHQGLELGLYFFEQIVEKTTTITTSLLGGEKRDVEEKVKHEQYSIYYLYGIPENKFKEVAAHELAHDWMQENYPDITDLKIKEGWAEYIASLVNNIYGNGKMNKRMEQNKNEIYGGGYRMVRKYVHDNDMDGLFDMFEKAK